MMKTKQKISGYFRSMIHARAFANLRSVIATAKKRMEEASQAAQEAIEAESALQARIRELKDKIRRLGGKL